MAHRQYAPEPDAERVCPECGSVALATRRVFEHLPCGHTYFADDGPSVDERCPKCDDRIEPDAVTHRGSVTSCERCQHTGDATAVAESE